MCGAGPCVLSITLMGSVYLTLVVVIYDCIIWTMRMRNDVYNFIYKCMLCCNCQSDN